MASAVEVWIERARHSARARRASLFRELFNVGPSTRILDIGSENGASIAAVLNGTRARANNVYIADINPDAIAVGSRRYGFVPVRISEQSTLPFEDGFFDVVHCSSVIEHVTVPKEQVWTTKSGGEFYAKARARQRDFAQEIRRLGQSYYVQTPNKWFPIESHTWLPLVGIMPRRLQIGVIHVANRYWIKGTAPDWCLLTAHDMRSFFPDAEICYERFMGLTKSIMALKR